MSQNDQLTKKERMKIDRQKMAEREPAQRATTFQEVNLGLAEQIAMLEAQRCLLCDKITCIDGCPVRVDIPGFINKVAEGDFAAAADILLRDNALPGICGRVCPQETQCEAVCLRGKGKGLPLAIGYLERFVADWARKNYNGQKKTLPKATGFKVAVVGSGPAGLTAAGELGHMGHAVTIFEAFHKPGGVLVYGIPEFRLPKEIVREEVDALQKVGVEIITNVIIGQTYTIDDLMTNEGYDAVFVANGAGLPIFLGIPGENLKGVYSANEYLTRVNLMKAYDPESETPVLTADQVVVIGGGNTAMDAVRTAKRLGAEPSTLVYRRSRIEMPARIEEVHHAEEEGIIFKMLTSPIEILGDDKGWVRAIRCLEMELGEPDDSGRRRPVPIKGSEFDIPCQIVVEAIGTRANPLLSQTTPDLKLNKWGYIEIDENGMTSKPGVFAGGDIVRGAATVILAMGDGKTAAASIDKYLKAK
ncbi:MAG: NADPH-dependent glutamate synthase [Planctomycetota bacterium]|jgi:glutamate synthase (NADPH/NADH) small chain